MAYKDTAKKTAYQNEFIKQAYDRINLTVPKGRKAELQALAKAQGKSVNGLLNDLIDQALDLDRGMVPGLTGRAGVRNKYCSPVSHSGASVKPTPLPESCQNSHLVLS